MCSNVGACPSVLEVVEKVWKFLGYFSRENLRFLSKFLIFGQFEKVIDILRDLEKFQQVVAVKHPDSSCLNRISPLKPQITPNHPCALEIRHYKGEIL